MMIYLELFWSYVQIGLFSIGGGYAAMPLIEEQVVVKHAWLSMAQFADIVTIAEMTPGPIAINSATFVGTMVAGLSGAIVATLGCIMPSCVIVMSLAWVYTRFRNLRVVQGVLSGLRPAVIAMIASAGLNLVLTALWGGSSWPISWLDLDIRSLVLFLASFLILRLGKVSPIRAMIGAGAAGVILFSIV